MTDLSGKSAIITGASRGIGAASATHLASLGAHVVLAARSADDIKQIADQINGTGGKALAITCDVGQQDSVQALIDQTVTDTGRLDILVNNAGLIDPISRIDESAPADWSQVVDVNLKGVYYGIRFALPHMLTNKGGTIINISSGAATGALEGWSHYCATKAAVLSLTKCTDKEYRAHGIRCLGLSPGTVATDMQVKIKASGINPVSQLDPDMHIPADWVAQAIAYLSTPNSDDYLGTDFSLKTPQSRAALNLPAP